MIATLIGFAVPALIVLALILIIACGYVKAPPDMAYIISGVRKKPRVLVGQAGIKIPFFERMDKLSLGAVQIDVNSRVCGCGRRGGAGRGAAAGAGAAAC